jgi:hypothetical protein
MKEEITPFADALTAFEENVRAEKASAGASGHFDTAELCATVLREIEGARRIIELISAGQYLTPAETTHSTLLAKKLLLQSSQPDPDSYWRVTGEILKHSRRLV